MAKSARPLLSLMAPILTCSYCRYMNGFLIVNQHTSSGCLIFLCGPELPPSGPISGPLNGPLSGPPPGRPPSPTEGEILRQKELRPEASKKCIFWIFRPKCKQMPFGASLSNEFIKESRAAPNLNFHSSSDSKYVLEVEPFIAKLMAPDPAEVENNT